MVLVKLTKRNINIDLVKCVAVYLVLSVHFFANNGFYKIAITKDNFTGIGFRTFFMICVPLFMVTTGYLMKNKELSKKYYYGVIRVIMIYVMDGFLYAIYRHLYYPEPFTIKHTINMILSFDIGYSWYIEMYLGLFLLIPFLNLIFNNLKDQKAKTVLVLTMLVLTAFPGIFNTNYHLLPAWWTRLYPISYYFLGCYLKEYDIKINKVANIILIIIILEISTMINIRLSFGNRFVCDAYNDWGCILNVILTFLVFTLILNTNLDKLNHRVKRVIAKVSELSLGIYLTSAIIDDLLYYNYFRPWMVRGITGYFKIVPLVFILSASLSMIINTVYNFINKLFIEKYIKPLFFK